PIQHVGSCSDVCTAAPGDGPTVWASCTLNRGTPEEVSFLPLTTYLSAESVFLCGDGVCQFTEDAASCPADCPPGP
ncbi:MAG TPA: hypothetical protein VEP68_11145, partial [Anaeromyxobacteraceae bacterium]|nr:hypothetical protein [Anaeromyxobacteraceae bacterium]